MKDDLERVTRRIKEVEIMIEEADQTHKPLLHPSMAGQYRREVMALKDTLNKEEHRSAAAQHLRTLVEKIVLTPKQDQEGLQIDLHGDLAGIMQIALKERKDDIDNSFLLDQLGCMTLHASETEPVDRIGSGGWI
ncbi:MAG: hypothetical protein KTR20_12080 [Cellvibrionaceae bacterium]|nr:hypothetical protein [Cellvibrionaceae bacterium]